MPQTLIQSTDRFQPCYCSLETAPEWGEGWRVYDIESDDKIIFEEDLKYARKLDCELVCKSLNDATALGEDVMEVDDGRFAELLSRYLQW